jgi:hypothetical protein
MSLWTSAFGEEQATGFTHYIGHYILFTYYFGWARFYVGLVIEGLVIGAVAVIVYDRMTSSRSSENTKARSMFSLWLPLSFGWLIMYGAWLLVSYWLPELLDSWLRYSPRRQMAFEFGIMPMFFVILMSVCYFLLPSIAIYRESVWRALKRSVALFLKMPFTFFFLSLTFAIVPLLLTLIQNRPGVIVEKFNPELMAWIALAGVFADVLLIFAWVTTAVRMLVEVEE